MNFFSKSIDMSFCLTKVKYFTKMIHTLVPLIVVYTRLLFFGKNFRGSTFIRVYMFITWDRIFTLYMFIRDYMFITWDRILNLLSHNIT